MSTKEGFLGIRERFIEVEETTYGSNPGLDSGDIIGTNVIFTPTFNQGFQEVVQAGSDQRTMVKKIPGPLSIAYDLEYNPVSWRRLKYMFDIDSETGSDPYTHTLSIGNTQKSYSAEWAIRHDSDPLIYQLTGCVNQQMTINFQKTSGEGRDGFIKCSEKVIAQDFDKDQSLTAGDFSTSLDPFQYRHTNITLEGNSITEVNSGQLMFTQGINPNDSRYANSGLDRKIGTPINTVFRVSGRFNVNVFDTTYTDLWATAEKLSGTNTFVFEQSGDNKATFTLTDLYVEPVPLSATNLDGISSVDFVFTAKSVAIEVIDSIENW